MGCKDRGVGSYYKRKFWVLRDPHYFFNKVQSTWKWIGSPWLEPKNFILSMDPTNAIFLHPSHRFVYFQSNPWLNNSFMSYFPNSNNIGNALLPLHLTGGGWCIELTTLVNAMFFFTQKSWFGLCVWDAFFSFLY